MSIHFATKEKFILDLLNGMNGKYLTPREIGKKFNDRFFLPKTIVVVEPVKLLHRVLQNLFNDGKIQKMGVRSYLRDGSLKN